MNSFFLYKKEGQWVGKDDLQTATGSSLRIRVRSKTKLINIVWKKFASKLHISKIQTDVKNDNHEVHVLKPNNWDFFNVHFVLLKGADDGCPTIEERIQGWSKTLNYQKT